MTPGGFAYGDARYRLRLDFDAADVGRRVVVCFGAVATHCMAYFNGRWVWPRVPCVYLPVGMARALI